MKPIMRLVFFSLAIGWVFAAGGAEEVITNLIDLIAARHEKVSLRYRLSGIILDSYDAPVFYSDGRVIIINKESSRAFPFKVGDALTLTGSYRRGILKVDSYQVEGHQPPPPAELVTPEQVQSGEFANRFVSVQGLVADLFQDDIDSQFLYFVLTRGSGLCYAALPLRLVPDELKRKLLGAEIRLTGVCQSPETFLRPYMGCNIRGLSGDALEIITPASTSQRAAPLLDVPPYSDPQTIASLGVRRIEGTVVAVSSDRSFVLKSDIGNLHRITLRSDQTMPRFRDRVTAYGQVRTDFYLINLVHAVCETTGRSNLPLEKPLVTSPDKILFNDQHEHQAKPQFYGKVITLIGNVTHPRATTSNDRNLYLDCDSLIIPIDLEGTGLNADDFEPGSTVSATGLCLMDIQNWSSDIRFSKIDGFVVSARIPEDLKILSRPPWLTLYRAAGLALVLLTLLIGTIIWNRTLQRQVRRRTLALLRARAAKDRSDLKTGERTRLAVELHDSLSQNLAGIGCQLVATRQALSQGAEATEARLKTAENMLLSTRVELKRCLFDLRNDALEEPDFETAIRKTIAPIAANANVSIRFVVLRSRLDDSHAHTILSIIRELCANAICHGKARNIRIAGTSESNQVLFSVKDDGMGFDPATCAGPGEGHFGLSGIRTRIKKFNGTLTFSSHPQRGTNAKVTLTIG